MRARVRKRCWARRTCSCRKMTTCWCRAWRATRTRIGYFGFAYYVENEGKLRDLAIEGVSPSEATVDAGEYKLARPLFMYSDAKIMTDKPQVADFINYYLTNVNDEIAQVGYFPASAAALDQAKQAWLDAMGQ